MEANERRRLHALVASQLGVDAQDLGTGSRFLDDLGVDSLDVVELVMVLEESFDIVVLDEDVEGFATLGDVEAYLEKRIAA